MISDEVIAVFVLGEDVFCSMPVNIGETKVAALAVVGATELAIPDDECVIVHSARLETAHPKTSPPQAAAHSTCGCAINKNQENGIKTFSKTGWRWHKGHDI